MNHIIHTERSEPQVWWKRWILRCVLIAAGLCIALVVFNGAVNFHASRIVSASPVAENTIPTGHAFSAVTLNTWRLCDIERVPAMVGALRVIG